MQKNRELEQMKVYAIHKKGGFTCLFGSGMCPWLNIKVGNCEDEQNLATLIQK